VENREPEAAELLKRLFPRTGRATLIGVTGAAGSGKSTLVDALVRALRSRNHSVGVLAVDPTSPFSGGAMLGDRVRMQAHASDPGTFIRSMATRGSLGGVAAATFDAALVLDAAGKDFILVETVGVGQDEVEIARLADVTLLLLVPGAGDDVQALKAGIMEIADIFVINKSDLDGADRLEEEIRGMQSLSPEGSGWRPPIVRTVATRAEGVDGLLAAVNQHLDFARGHGILQQRRQAHWRARLLQMLREQALERAAPQALADGVLDRYAAAIAARETDPYSVADQILAPGAQVTRDQ
jgi:LAO/AO transport system kinase